MCGVFDYKFQVRIQGFMIQVEEFSKRAVNHYLITRKLILCYIRSKKDLNYKDTPPCTFKRSGVS